MISTAHLVVVVGEVVRVVDVVKVERTDKVRFRVPNHLPRPEE